MNLIIPYTGTRIVVAVMRTRSNKAGVPPLPYMKGGGNIIVRVAYSGVGSGARGEFKELLNPINENASGKHIKGVFPIQRPINKGGQFYPQHSQCQEMPPDELKRFLGFIPNVLNVFHDLPLLYLLILSDLPSKKPMQNNCFFKKGATL